MNPVLLLAALLPAIILLIRVYKLDKIEKEPRGLLLKLVLFGALSGVAASLIEAVLTRLLNRYYSGSELGYLLLENFVAVALVEELCKHWPEPYKGKGIKYANEVIRHKEGKAGGKK